MTLSRFGRSSPERTRGTKPSTRTEPGNGPRADGSPSGPTVTTNSSNGASGARTLADRPSRNGRVPMLLPLARWRKVEAALANPRRGPPLLRPGRLHQLVGRAADTDVLLVRQHGRVCALVHACAHLGGPLSEGMLKDGSVVCPWHGSEFALDDGRVLNGPATHNQPCLVVRERDGRIRLQPANDQMSPIYVHEDDVMIQGIVVGVLRRY